VKVRVERVLDGTAFATLAGAGPQAAAPITAEGLAEKPTRASRSRKVAEEPVGEAVEAVEVEAVAEEVGEEPDAAPKKKRTRRGSRGGRNRRKKPAAAAASSSENGEVVEAEATPKIHLPAADLGAEASEDGGAAATAEQAPKKKRTRRGSRGGRRRRKPAAAVSADAPAESSPE
jgi:ribonuclease E